MLMTARRWGRLGLWAAVASLALWARSPSWVWVIAASVGTLGTLISLGWRPGFRSLAGLMCVAGIIGGVAGHREFRQIKRDWTAYWQDRLARAESELINGLDELLQSGEEAAAELARMADRGTEAEDGSALQAAIESSGMAAAAIYDVDGRLESWAGSHRGLVPESVKLGQAPYLYKGRPLFSYLYFTEPVAGGGTAMVAAVISVNLPGQPEPEVVSFASRFEDRTGERVRILRADRPQERGVLEYVWREQVLLNVAVVEPTRSDRLASVRAFWAQFVGGLSLLAWLILAAGTAGRRRDKIAGSIALVVLATTLPFGLVPFLGDLFSAGYFLLPGLGDVTLGRVAVVTAALALLLAHPPRSRRAVGTAATMGLVVVGYPAATLLMQGGPSAQFLAGTIPLWLSYQATLALILALIAVLAFRVGVSPREGSTPTLALAATVGLVVVLAALAATRVWLSVSLPWWAVAFWSLPAATAALVLSRLRGWKQALAAWALAGLLGSSAALVTAWSGRVEARMVSAEEQLRHLESQEHPYLNFLLYRLVDVVQALDATDVEPVELLYESWVDSGLADYGGGVWLTLWSSDGIPGDELRIGTGGRRPAVADDVLLRAADVEGPFVERLSTGDANYLVQVPLRDGQILTAVVPQPRDLRGPSPFGPLFGRLGFADRDPLTLVPLLEGDLLPEPGLNWQHSATGWEARLTLTYPDGVFDARYALELASRFVLVARASLLILLDILIVLALWTLGQWTLLGRRPFFQDWRAPWASFRARVTLSLIGFFLLSTAILGTLAVRTLALATERTAAALAERVAADASSFYFDADRRMSLLADRVGADLLEYRAGELRGGSVDELVELGLHEGWIPMEINRRLESREVLVATQHTSIGRWEYLMAYSRLPDGDVVATPVPLHAGATALHEGEVGEIVGFVIVLGGILSLGLAFLVGRTLTRPIQTLQIASEAVGSGNLTVQLPSDRPDEFGSVFNAFNRMVLRLRRARRALERTTRRTQAIMEEAATGVVALDADRQVTLINPMAQRLLGGGVEVGEPLPASGEPLRGLTLWIQRCFEQESREGTTEVQFGDRRIRVRSRPVSQEGPAGAVLSLEDITDELRTERILAWGEMARQVAHEVKNPLTPIKLSVQHIRRAWRDKKGDFDPILNRNVEAILKEIDHLSSIASAFSRFGAPQEAGSVPLEPVNVLEVAEEVLALYRSGEQRDSVRFGCTISGDTPLVQARASELKEVLINLLENARAAIEEGGSVIVASDWSTSEVEVRVTDDGTGIPEDVLARIFEPHFSTRSAGTGLGLAIVERLVGSWGGSVTAESARGEGTEVRVRLLPWGEEAQRVADAESTGADVPSD
ncbi:MAG: ATP-binding protein [Longimicrobiales bacterium]